MKNLIVKLGAMGDVVRTTVLLHELPGEIYWLTKKSSLPFLNSPKISKRFCFDEPSDITEISKMKFQRIISLEEEIEILKFVKKLDTEQIIGAYLDNQNNINYTPSSTYWFDMSRISKLGASVADSLKKQNIKSVPEILFGMIDGTFCGQEYDLNTDKCETVPGRVGLIDECTGSWPNKHWFGYKKLSERLAKNGLQPYFLEIKPSLEEHIRDIGTCQVIVCGDTLGMHIALALKKNIIALFNCTSPHEIEGYSRMKKIISPLLYDFYYKKGFNEEATRAIDVNTVYNEVLKFYDKVDK